MFLIRLLQPIMQLFRTLFAPFRQARMGLMRLRMLNPFRIFSNTFQLYRIRGFFTRLKNGMRVSRYFRIPAPIKAPLQRFGLFKNDAKKRKKSSQLGANPDEADPSQYVYYRKRGRRSMADRAEMSQIHLIHQASGLRTVVHIGTTTGESTAEVLLEHSSHSPIKLRFKQVNPDNFGSQVVVSHVAGRADVFVNGLNLYQDIALTDKMIITVDGSVYNCELFAWDDSTFPPDTRVQAGWESNIGPRRKLNEDAIGIYQHRDAYMFVIADGVGGGEAGERISEFATRYMLAVFHRNVRYRLPWSDIFAMAMRKINEEVWHFTQRAAIGRAGSTLTVVVVKQWDAHIGHVGDSRIYHYGRRGMKQITTDHIRPLNEDDTRFDGRQDPMMILTKGIGKEEMIEPELKTIRLQPGDKLLMCSDGLTNVVEDEDIRQHLREERPAKAVENLINLAIDRRATDNISAIAFDVLSQALEYDMWRAVDADRVFAGETVIYPLRHYIDLEYLTTFEVVTPKRVLNIIFVMVIIFAFIRLVPIG